MRHLNLTLLCTLATPALVAMAQPCTSPPGAIGTLSYLQPPTCYPRLVWTTAPGATKYFIYRSTTCNINDATLVGITTTPHFEDTAFPAPLYSQNICYHVRGINNCGQGPASQLRTQFSAGSWVPPKAITARCNEVTIEWNPLAATPGTPVSYSVWRKPHSSSPAIRIAQNLTTTSYVDRNSPPDMFEYFVSTRAVECEGPMVRVGVASGNPLARPILTAESFMSCGTVHLTWQAGACVTEFTVFRTTVENPETTVEVGRTTAREFYDHPQDRSVSYNYSVIAHSPSGDSPRSYGYGAFVYDIAPVMHPIEPPGEVPSCPLRGVWLRAPLQYQFEHDLMFIQWFKNGEPLNDGGNILGAHDLDLLIFAPTEPDDGAYTVSVTTDCGHVLSDPLNVRYQECTFDCPPCTPDFNQDGGVDGSDLYNFFSAWEASEYCADVNQDGGIDGQDLDYWMLLFELGDC